MRAAVLTQFNQPWELKELPDPRPAPGQVLMRAWAEGCTVMPKELSWEEGAPIFCAGFTAFSGLRNAEPRPGDRVAVIGIGGLGHLAIQFSKALGLETIAITGSAGKRDEAK